MHSFFCLNCCNITFLEITAIVCGVPVMISDCEQDIDMREKEPSSASFAETNLVKDNTNMELDVSLNSEEMLETSDCKIHNKMNQLKDISLCDTSYEKNCADMELQVSRNEKTVKASSIEIISDLKESVVVEEILEKNNLNTETTISSNEKAADVPSFDIITEMQGEKDAILSVMPLEKESAKMEIENYASEKTASVSCQTLIDAENLQKSNLCKSCSKKDQSENLDISAKDKELSYAPGKTFYLLIHLFN